MQQTSQQQPAQHPIRKILIQFVAFLFLNSVFPAIADNTAADFSTEHHAITTSATDNPQEADTQASDQTPQPPLVDAQQEPRYEPEKSSEPPTQNDDQPEIDNASESPLDEPSQPDKAGKQHSALWLDTHPTQVSADWLQLTSGEWLRGRIISMQKNILEFDSDELNTLDIKWEKVKYIKSNAPYSLRFDNNVTAIGSIEINQDKIYVSSDYDDEKFDRNALLIIASGRDTELSRWSSKITFSLNIRKGNTNQTDFTSKFNAKRRTLISRLILDYLGNFTQVENAQTINNHRATATYDVFITRNFFWTLLSSEYFRDPFQNIDRRLNSYTALGYSLINNNETEWDVSAGPGYQETKYESVEKGSSTDQALVLILSTRFVTELTSKVDLEGLYNVTLGDSRTGNYQHHSIFTITTELTDRLDFDVTTVWDRTQKPVPDENDVAPERDDLRFLIGLGYDL